MVNNAGLDYTSPIIEADSVEWQAIADAVMSVVSQT